MGGCWLISSFSRSSGHAFYRNEKRVTLALISSIMNRASGLRLERASSNLDVQISRIRLSDKTSRLFWPRLTSYLAWGW